MSSIDVGFILAVAAFGWGLSLATYRIVAGLYRWPMGAWQLERPRLPRAIGALAMTLAIFFAAARGYGGHALSAWGIPILGIAWAVFWTGFLRVGAQSALLLAPAAAMLLIVRWLS